MADKKPDAPDCASCNPTPEDVFIREVSEEVRLGKVAEFWKNNGMFIISLALAVLLGVTLRQVINYYRDNVMEKEMQTFEKSERGDDELEKMVNDFRYGYRKVAAAELSQNYLQAKKYEEALALFDSESKNAPNEFDRELASLKKALLLASMDERAALELAAKIKKSGKYFKPIATELELSLTTDAATKKALAEQILKDETSAEYLKKIAAIELLK